ncbi:hypothetical protein QYF61_009166 [Mycteria americana]|uniref:Rna-directed dna polymerase from mobile element jockey-like n=1 Tax=Mycteria americana TaxID=33587 RepID=A0AAN7NUF9_MYCAM|nr:hypothetical protein QYF61_009166 [Mycteria americana]
MTWSRKWKCFLIKFVENIKLGEQVNPLEERAGIQGDLDKLEEWTGRNFMKLNKNKSEVLHMGRNNPLEQYRLETDWLGSSSAEKTLGVLADTKPYISQQCALAAKVSSRLGYMSRSTASRGGEVNIPLKSVLSRLHLEYYVLFWVPKTRQTLTSKLTFL